MAPMSRPNSISGAIRFLKNGILGVLEVAENRVKPAHPYISIAGALLKIFQLFVRES